MNKVTTMLTVLLAILIGSTSVWAQDVTKIRDARQLEEGTEVTIEGILTTPDYGFDNNQFFMQDSTAGIAIIIFNSDTEGNNADGNSPFAAGDSITITGTTGSYNGLVQLESAAGNYTIISSDNELPAPVAISPADIKTESEYQGMRVSIAPVSLAEGEEWPEDAQSGSGVNVDVVAGDSTFTLRIDRDESYFDGAEAPGEKFQLIGNLGAFYSPQVFPFYETDIKNIYDVSFTINTSTIPDTLSEEDFIQLRGAVNGAGGDYLGQMIDWNDQSDLVAENQGGDYWTIDFIMAEGDEFVFKVWSGFDATSGTENGDGGWEIIDENRSTRTFSAMSDTSVTLYADSQTAPYESVEDSVTMFFRVNVGAFVQDESFNPETDSVGLRGNPDVFQNPSDWSSTAIYLEREEKGVETSDNLFYSGSVRVDQAAADTLGSLPYKFVLETETGTLWDNVDGNTDGNRFIDVPSADSTIHWVYFQEKAPTSAEIVTTDITFEVNVAILEVLGYFDSGVGDQVVVRGEPPLDWGTSDFNTASFDDQDIVWRLTNTFTKAVGSEFAYKYYIEYDDSRTDETSDNYIEAIAENVDFGYEEPVTTGGADRMFEVQDMESQGTGVQYYNGVNIGGLIDPANTPDGTVAVTFRIDMSAALEHEVPFRPEEDSLYFQFESKYTALTQGVRSGNGYFEDVVNNGTPEDLEPLRFTPVEGEANIYELTMELQLPTLNDFGFVVKYGQPFTEFESMVTNGSGFDAGRRYYQFIEPTSVDYNGEDPFLGELYVSQWPTTYTMPTVTWAAEDLEFDVQPDYAALATSTEEPSQEITGYELSQNYPNPFNPTTKINFVLPSVSEVNLTVYNLLGQKVTSLVSGQRMNAGSHTVAFDASALSSGIYFYELKAGNFVQQRKMTLIK
ncbi:T9SS type A sorting domain-containing protein [Gracilimonas mengyeensis]|uniref:Por secretion system C-terminal sorting domain-containing protein n=1 Tax=Gracilimonas mengyeensis TaxID=1302730 RepID=A0A521DVU4_9BACT|nr:T9SS type A sorting domain-containing protein [Gracilimonas mengyeensis]SMO75817.1 Por secretion system C-terminal sorting domain-containing protein [Gracilimonas mengyeensis]